MEDGRCKKDEGWWKMDNRWWIMDHGWPMIVDRCWMMDDVKCKIMMEDG